MEEKSNDKPRFDPQNLSKTVIAIPLLAKMEAEPEKNHEVIIDTNLEYVEGRERAQKQLIELIESIAGENSVYHTKTEYSQQYVFARLNAEAIRRLVQSDLAGAKEKYNQKLGTISEDPAIRPHYSPKSYQLIYKIWPDFEIGPLITESIKTVKADAAKVSFSALGSGIVWAVLDSGIDDKHPHFNFDGNKTLDTGFDKDFTALSSQMANPFRDGFGHGTHVAGIIAGEQKADIRAAIREYNEKGQPSVRITTLPGISGMASRCKLVSLKVLNDSGGGNASNIIAAINHIQEINGYGRYIKIHGVNISIGNRFEPEWFACGQSPLCVEVNRLVKSGVVVVVAAGNTGYGFTKTQQGTETASGLALSINDPGNAEFAITVGSTHREMPHIYGVSYFSSKGPTGDGRLKPDLVAPGEKIISCAVGKNKNMLAADANCDYCEDSGTSMAAPHVSGLIAAFLSIRKEFIGQPEKVKEIFTSTATDLRRDKYFQGHGLVDLMRAIQSV